MGSARLSPETRHAIEVALLSGETAEHIATRHGVHPATIWRIKKQLRPAFRELRDRMLPGTAPLTLPRRDPDPDAVRSIGALDIAERMNEYLGATFDSLVAVLKHSTDPAWLQRQNAHDLGIFFGIATDKATRVLQAIRPDDDGGETERLSGPR